jgi:hypothetical protein
VRVIDEENNRVAIGSMRRIRSSASCQTAINIEAQPNALAAIGAICENLIFVFIRRHFCVESSREVGDEI